MTTTAPVSNDPSYTVSPEVLASNLIVLGSIPPVIPAEDAAAFVAHHGEAYGKAVLAIFATYGITVHAA